MPNGNVPPAIVVSKDVLSGGAARCVAEAVRGNIKFTRSSFQDGNNPNDGLLMICRWRLPALWGVVERTNYEVSVLRYELGYDPELQDRIIEAIAPHTAALSTYLELDGSSRRQDGYGDISVSMYCPTKGAWRPTKPAFTVNVTIWGSYLNSHDADHLHTLLQSCLDRTGLGFELIPDDYHIWGEPKESVPAEGLYLYLNNQGNFGERTKPVSGFSIEGFASMQEAAVVARKILAGFEMRDPQTHFSWNGKPDWYDDLRVKLNPLTPGWCADYLGKRRADVDPYEVVREFGPDTPRWIPLLQWMRGNKYTFVLSILRFPDGLRLEFSSSCRDNWILEKEIRRVAGPIEVIPVEPGSEFDIE